MTEKLGGERQTHEAWQKDLEAVDLEIVRLSIICQVKLLEPGVIAHVLDDQAWVCGNDQPNAFQSLRGLLFLHYELQKELVEAFGAVDTAEIILKVREHLSVRVGDQLGKPA
jgi:hypothetical protein